VVRLQFADRAGYTGALTWVDALTADPHLLTVDVATDGSAAEVHALLGWLTDAGTPARKVSVHRPSLDAVFLSLTSPRGAAREPKEVSR
jgi:ABC-2 type transport system ATP-binding protein